MTLRIITITLIALSVYSCTKLNAEEVAAKANTQKFCDMDTVHFTDIAPLISSNCLPCHDNSQAQGGVTLVTYDDISFLALDGILLNSINHASGLVPMPSGAPKLNDCYIQAITHWTTQGALNN